MACAAFRHVAIWIDRNEAILLAFEVGPSDGSVPHRPGDGWSQHRVDAHHYPLVRQYYDAVLSHLESQDEIWILGPGQVKHELRHQIEQHGALKGRVVGLHDASTLADVEMVFLNGEGWHVEKAGGAQADPLSRRPAREFPERSGTLR